MSYFPRGLLTGIAFHVTLFTKQTVFCQSDSEYLFEFVNRRTAVYNLIHVFNILSNGTHFFIYCKLGALGCNQSLNRQFRWPSVRMSDLSDNLLPSQNFTTSTMMLIKSINFAY